jgi:hypothetical protein
MKQSMPPLAIALAGAIVLATAAWTSTTERQPRWDFVVRVSGIPVQDSAGRPMRDPFLGGFDLPRPQLVDIDGDGRVELFVQERHGEVMMFRRDGDDWTWVTDRFQDINVGEWYRFADIDRDGDVDLLGEMVSGYLRIWRNEGTARAARFVALGDTVRDVDGQALVVDRQNILNALDVDCNGRLDLMVGRVQGTLLRYEQEGTSPDGSPRFRLLDEMWQGIEVLGPEATGGSLMRTDTTDRESWGAEPHDSRRHGANTVAFADIDGKGLVDLFWGDFFEEGLLRFRNTGSCANPDLTGRPARFPEEKPVLTSGYNAAAFGDVDGDSLPDLILGVIGGAYGPYRTAIENLHHVRQSPRGSWTTLTRRLIPTIDVGSEAAPAFGDLTGDGLLDLVIGSKMDPADDASGTLHWYENVGSRTAPAFRERGRLPVRGHFNYAPAIVDLDGDSLPDLIVGSYADRLQWWRNTGTRSAPRWSLTDSALVTITRGTNTTPSFGDLDGDGLVDLMIGEASGTLNFYRNAGSRTAPRFTLVTDNFQAIKLTRRSAPALVDLDGNGRLDLLLGSDNGEIQLWLRAPGSEVRFERDSTFVLRSHTSAIPAVADLHGRGRPDLFFGTLSGGIRWFESRR